MPKEDTYFTSDNQPDPSKKGSKGILKLKTVIKQLLDQEITDNDGKKLTRYVKMCNAILLKAEEGDVQAFRSLGDRLEGQPKQEIEQTGGNTVIINRPPPRKKPKRKKDD